MAKMTKTFFSKSRAEEFAERIESFGYKTEIWGAKDGFKQTIYIVKWVEDDDENI